MSVVVITPPEPIVSLAEAKVHLQVEAANQDSLITAYIAAATEALDGPGGFLNRALGEQEVELRLDAFDHCSPIPLPLADVRTPTPEVASVIYVDADGDEQTLDANAYDLTLAGLSPIYATAWPATRAQSEAVRVRYTAGWPMEDGVWAGPAPIRAAILLIVGDLFANRQIQVIAPGAVAQVTNKTANTLLAPWRIWTF